MDSFHASMKKLGDRIISQDRSAGASITIYQWRQMRHGQFWGESIKSLILSFNIQQYEFCAQI